MSFTYRLTQALRFCFGRPRPYTAAIVLAGGNGSRMLTEGVAKQYLLVDGIPVLVRSLRAFDECEYIDELVVVTRKCDMGSVKLLLAEYPMKKPVRLVSGGETRQASARHGLEAVTDKTKYIAIHDAARCLVTPEMISDVVSAAYACRAASAGCAVTDTVKRISSRAQVLETLDRRELFLAQTPQVFDISLYRAAAYAAKRDGLSATDDNMLVETLGHTVQMVDCGRENIKITVEADLHMAEAILAARARRGRKG